MSSSRLDKLQEMAAKRPNDPFPLYGLAMEYVSLQRYEEAAKRFRSLLDDHPEYTAAFLHYGRTLLALGEDTEAERIYRKGIEVCSRNGADHARAELEEALGLL